MIRRIRIVGPRKHPSSWHIPRKSVEVHVDAPMSVRGEWESALLATEYLAASSADPRLRPVGILATGGDSTPAGPAGEPPQVASAPDRAAALARRAGASVVEARRVGDAAALTVRVADPAPFLKPRLEPILRALPRAANFVAVEDRYGYVVLAAGSLPPTSGGRAGCSARSSGWRTGAADSFGAWRSFRTTAPTSSCRGSTSATGSSTPS